jgi:hypothetical protein
VNFTFAYFNNGPKEKQMSETFAALSTVSRGLWRALQHNWAVQLEQIALKLCPSGEHLAMTELIVEKDIEIKLLRTALKPFADISLYSDRNGYINPPIYTHDVRLAKSVLELTAVTSPA